MAILNGLCNGTILDSQVLDSQLATNEIPVVRVVLVVVAIALSLFAIAFTIYHQRYADPYIQSVLSLSGDADRGQVIFQMNCASCHGINGDGQVGPSLRDVGDRKSRLGLIKQVISGKTPPMPQFQPTPQEMADLLEYLERL